NTITQSVPLLKGGLALILLEGVGGSSSANGNSVTLSGNTNATTDFVHALQISGAGTGAFSVANNTFNGGGNDTFAGSGDSTGILLDSSIPAAVALTVTGNTVNGFVRGVDLLGGAATFNNNNFEGGAANPDNGTDLRLGATAGPVAGGTITGNTFAGTTFYIDNQSTQNLTALATSNVYKRDNATVETNNFRIEDKMFHKVDDPTKGLITW